MSTRLVILALLLTFGIKPTHAVPADWTTPLVPFQISGNLYYVGSRDLAAYLVVTPGGNEPSGFILTTILGIVGAFLVTYLGQAIGWYRADEGAGLIGAVVGAIIILVIWGIIDRRRRPSP